MDLSCLKDQKSVNQKLVKYLENNPRKALLLRLAGSEASDSNSPCLQLRYAIYGGGTQCGKCLKYFALTPKTFNHKQECGDLPIKMWRYPFAKLPESDLYFCYFGCTKAYKKQVEIAKHLLDEHRKKMHLWGISPVKLELKYDLTANTKHPQIN